MTQQPGDYQQPAPQPVQHYPQYAYRGNIATQLAGRGRLSVFLFLGALLLFIGVMFLNLCFSGLIEGDVRALIFIGNILFELGFIAIISLLFLGGISREDLPENTRAHLIRAAGFGLGLYILTWTFRILGGMIYGIPYLYY